MDIYEIQEHFKSLDVEKEIAYAIEDKKNELSQQQRIQMQKGKNALGKDIGKYKSAAYARLKAQLGINPFFRSGFKDLLLTGDTQRQIFVDARNDGVVIDSAADPIKVKAIIEREGEDVFGLNDESTTEFVVNHLDEAATNRITNFLYGQ